MTDVSDTESVGESDGEEVHEAVRDREREEETDWLVVAVAVGVGGGVLDVLTETVRDRLTEPVERDAEGDWDAVGLSLRDDVRDEDGLNDVVGVRSTVSVGVATVDLVGVGTRVTEVNERESVTLGVGVGGGVTVQVEEPDAVVVSEMFRDTEREGDGDEVSVSVQLELCVTVGVGGGVMVSVVERLSDVLLDMDSVSDAEREVLADGVGGGVMVSLTEKELLLESVAERE